MENKKVILVIDDSENDYLIINRLLQEEYEVIYDNGQNGIDSMMDNIRDNDPICILLDYNLGILKGIELLKELQFDANYKHISVIILTNEINPQVIVDCIKANAENYLIKDQINKSSLKMAIRSAVKETNLNLKIQEQQDEIIKLSRLDGLTGLFNRRYFISKVEDEIIRLNRSGNYISLSVIDIDNFKSVNDSYGHLIGDEVLKIVGDVIKNTVRKTDLVSRYGGDEFALCLVEALNSDKLEVINNHLIILKKISDSIKSEIEMYLKELSFEDNLKKVSSTNFEVTASIGMTFAHKKQMEFHDLFHLSDQCLYHVKDNGKDNIAYIEYGDREPVFLKKD